MRIHGLTQVIRTDAAWGELTECILRISRHAPRPRNRGTIRRSRIAGLSLILTAGAIAVPVATGSSTGPGTAPVPAAGAESLMVRSAAYSNDALAGVACTSARACMSVGNTTSNTLAEAWNGTRWRVVKTPANSVESYLASVSCRAANACLAVGQRNEKTLAESWNGVTWKILATPSPSFPGTTPGYGMDGLTGVSDISATDAWAVGYRSTPAGRTGNTLIEHWNGHDWSVVTSPNPVGSTTANTADNSLAGVSCSSARACVAVGTWGTSLSYLRTLAEVWNGRTWKIGATPTPVAYEGDILTGVSALSANDVWAVGGRGEVSGSAALPGNILRTLIEHWNGRRWSVIASPNPLVVGNELSGVAAVSTRNVWAAGTIGKGLSLQPLAVHWNGVRWTRVAMPKPKGYSTIAGVGRIPGTPGLWAVGGTTVGSVTTPLIERWTGTRWVVTATPAVPGG